MVITKQMMETVRPLGEENPIDRVLLPVSEILGGNVNVLTMLGAELSINKRSTTYVQLWINGVLGVTVYVHQLFNAEKSSFPFATHIPMGQDETTLSLEQHVRSGEVAALILKHKAAIVDYIEKLIPLMDKYIARENLKSWIRWSFENVTKFFETHQQNGTVDTDMVLRKLWKEEKDVWSKAIPNSYRGKNQSFDNMRKAIDTFEGALLQIENKEISIEPIFK